MGQIAGELAEGGELFGLLLDAGHLAHAVKQSGDDALGHGGNGREHLGEFLLHDEQGPDWRDRETLAARRLHARERQQSRHLSRAADEQLHRSAALPAHVNLTFEDKDHAIGWLALFEQDVSRLRDDLLAMLREPEAIFKRQAL